MCHLTRGEVFSVLVAAEQGSSFARGFEAYTSRVNATANLRGDSSSIRASYVPSTADVSLAATTAHALIVGGGLDDLPTSYVSNVPWLSPIRGAAQSYLSGRNIYGIAPTVQAQVTASMKALTERTGIRNFTFVGDGSRACNRARSFVRTKTAEVVLSYQGNITVSTLTDPVMAVAALPIDRYAAYFVCVVDLSYAARVTAALAAKFATITVSDVTGLSPRVAVLLHGPTEIIAALPAGTDGRYVTAVRWLPDVSATTDTFVSQCLSAWQANGYAAAALDESALHGCAAAAVAASVVAAMTDASTGDTPASRAATAILRVGGVQLSDSLFVGPWSSKCAEGVTSLRVSTLTAIGIDTTSDLSEEVCTSIALVPPAVFFQLYTNTTVDTMLADDLYAGMLRYSAESQSTATRRIRVYRLPVTDPSLSEAQSVPLQAAFKHPWIVGLLGSVGINTAAIKKLDVLSLGMESATYREQQEPRPYLPGDVWVYSQVAEDVDFATTLAIKAHGNGFPERFAVSAQPTIVASIGHMVSQRIDATLLRFGVKTGTVPIVSEALPTAPAGGPVRQLLVFGVPSASYMDSLFTLIESNLDLIVYAAPQTAEQIAFRNATLDWRARVASRVVSRLVLLADTIPLPTGMTANDAFLMPRLSRGYTLARFGEIVANSVDVAFASSAYIDRMYQSKEWIVGTTNFSGYWNEPCTASRQTRCSCNRGTRQRTAVAATGLVVAREVMDACAPVPVATEVTSRVNITEILEYTVAASLFVVATIVFLQAKRRSRSASSLEGVDGKTAKAITESASERMPWLYRISPLIYMTPFFAIALLTPLVFYQNLVNDIEERQAELAVADTNIAAGVDVLKCFRVGMQITEMLTAGVDPQALMTQFQTVCATQQQTYIGSFNKTAQAAQKQLASGAQPTALIATTRRTLLALTIGTASISPYVMETNVLLAAASSLQGAVSLVPSLLLLLPIDELVNAALNYRFTTNGGKGPFVAADTLTILGTFDSTVSGITARIPALQNQLPIAHALITNSSFADFSVLCQCVGRNVQPDGYLSTDAIACVMNALRSHGEVPALALARIRGHMAQFSSANLDEAIGALRGSMHTQLRSDQSGLEDLIRTPWGVATVLAVLVLFAAASVQLSVTAYFLSAFRDSSLLEAAVSRYVPLGTLDLMQLDSIHDISDEPVLRELTAVTLEYEHAFVAIIIARAGELEEADLIHRLAEALQVCMPEDAEVEHLTSSSCSLLFSDADAAIATAFEAESAFHAILNPKRLSAGHATASRKSTTDVVGPTVHVGIHRDTICMGFLSSGVHTFGGAFGHGIRISSAVAKLCGAYGASILATTSAVETVDTRGLDLRVVGPVRTPTYGPLVLNEVVLPVDRNDVDTYKRETLVEFNKIATLQFAASEPATEEEMAQFRAQVEECERNAQNEGIFDAALQVKLMWTGEKRYDNCCQFFVD
jgi:hypothetical protein